MQVTSFGMPVQLDLSSKLMTIQQGTYIKELLRSFGMEPCKKATTPTSANDPRDSTLLEDIGASHYRNMVGAVLYA
jgi:hypothetical protein